MKILLYNPDNGVTRNFMDGDGKKRLVMQVKPDGTPELTFLDPNGSVTGRYPK